jgi:hypothetical protein
MLLASHRPGDFGNFGIEQDTKIVDKKNMDIGLKRQEALHFLTTGQ